MWMTDYFEKEFNIKVYHKPYQFKLNNKEFFIGHGDGLGPKDRGYKRLKKYLQILFLDGFTVGFIPI